MSATHPVTLRVNGRAFAGEVEPRKHLADFLRHDLGLTGTHIGCEHGEGGALNPLQQAFRNRHGLQCGFCTPGMLMTLTAFLGEHPDADEYAIRDAISGNLCRCTGYESIVDAALDAARAMRKA